MLDPRFTLLVPSLPPSEGRKQGPEHVPDHGGRILETQGECWSVLGQTGGRRSGEVRRGQEGLLITVAGLWSGPWLLCWCLQCAHCAPHSRWPPVRGCQAKTLTASNPREAGGCWRWRKASAGPRLDRGWLVLVQPVAAAASCPHCPHRYIKIATLSTQLDIDNYCLS